MKKMIRIFSIFVSLFYVQLLWSAPTGPYCPTPQNNNTYSRRQPTNNYSNNNYQQHWLYDHENYGGHLIERHVAKSRNELIHRAQVERKPSVSSFYNLDLASEFVLEALEQNKRDIRFWLNDYNYKGNFAIELKYKIFENNGKPVRSGELYSYHDDKFYPAYSVKVVLIKDNRFEKQYRILTAYPID